MSAETITDLNQNVLIGYTDKRGTAWHYRASAQGEEPNHYAGPIPVEDVRRRLFSWRAVEGEITATALTSDGVLVMTDPTRKAIMRSDTGAILGIFKLGYRPHQYDEWLVQYVEALLNAEAKVGSAGLLAGGARAWVQIEMEDTLNVQGIAFRPHLTAATSFDGSLSTTYGTGVQLVVCDNTLSAALGSFTGRVKIRHSVNSLSRIDDARDALGILEAVGAAFTAQVEELLTVKVTDKQFQAFLDAHTELTDEKREKGGASLTLALNKQDGLRRLWNTDDRVAPWAGTAFGVVQAVNTYTHHEGTVRNVSRVERNMDRVIIGGVDKMDAATLSTLQAVLA
jgi:phage/plasmid-like protein (TIGR03299 family)